MKLGFKIFLWSILEIFLLLTSIGVRIVCYKPKAPSGLIDCAIVLGAGVTDEKPSPVFQARLEHVRDLYQSKQIKKVITTGGVGEGGVLSEGEVGAIFLITQGIPEQDIIQEKISKTTVENLRGAKAIMNQNNYQSAVLVSDPYHLRRSEMIAKYFEIETYTSPTPFTQFQSIKTKFPFLLSEIIFSIYFRLWKR